MKKAKVKIKQIEIVTHRHVIGKIQNMRMILTRTDDSEMYTKNKWQLIALGQTKSRYILFTRRAFTRGR